MKHHGHRKRTKPQPTREVSAEEAARKLRVELLTELFMDRMAHHFQRVRRMVMTGREVEQTLREIVAVAEKTASTFDALIAAVQPLRAAYGFNILFADEGKLPRRSWKEWQTSPQTSDDVRRLFDPDIHTCVGLICGFAKLLVVDFDRAWIYRLWRSRFRERAETHTIRTPHNGMHAYFLASKPATDDRFKETLATEVKGSGRYVVAAGKLRREDGSIGEYRVEDDAAVRADDNIADETLKWLAELRQRYHFLQWKCLHPIYLEKKILEPSHDARLIVAAQMVHEGFDDAEIHNFFRDATDYREETTQQQIASTRKNEELRPWRCQTILDRLGLDAVICRACSRKRELGEVAGERIERKQVTLPPRLAEYFTDKGKFVPEALAARILKEYSLVTFRDTREIFCYDGETGVWKPNGDTVVHAAAQKILGEHAKRHYIEEVLHSVRGSTYTERQDFVADPRYVNLANGVLDLETLTLKEPAPSFRFLQQLPVRYDPNADCPKIRKFLEEVQPDEENRQALLEHLATTLDRDMRYQTAYLLWGEGENGRSTWLGLVREFLGPENTTSQSLQSLEYDRFASAQLYGRLANICPDMSAKALERTSIFKTTTGGDQVSAQHKFKGQFNFVSYAKQFYSCNAFPMTSDTTYAFFRRMNIIEWWVRVPEEKRDRHLLEKLTTADELSGLLNVVLKARQQLHERDRFVNWRNVEDVAKMYLYRSDPVKAFVDDRIDQGDDYFAERDAIYVAFIRYCKQKRLETLSVRDFFARFRQTVPVTDFRPKETGGEGRTRCWKGVQLRGAEKMDRYGGEGA